MFLMISLMLSLCMWFRNNLSRDHDTHMDFDGLFASIFVFWFRFVSPQLLVSWWVLVASIHFCSGLWNSGSTLVQSWFRFGHVGFSLLILVAFRINFSKKLVLFTFSLADTATAMAAATVAVARWQGGAILPLGIDFEKPSFRTVKHTTGQSVKYLGSN